MPRILIRRRVAALSIMLTVAGNSAASAADALVATNLPGVRSYAAPPQGFNPAAASDDDLARYGFPPRPDTIAQHSAYAAWLRAVRAAKTRIVPILRQTGVFHMPMRLSTRPAPSAGAVSAQTNVSSSNWSGVADVNTLTKYGNTSYHTVAAEFSMPVAGQAFGSCTGGWDYGASWVGIDGYSSSDVLQSGIGYDAYCASNGTASYYDVWIEWYPYAESEITNLPVSPGDDMYIEVYSTSATVGNAYIVNETTNLGGSIQFDAPSGTRLVGNSAEWVVERPGLSTGLATLTNYVTTWFSNAAFSLVNAKGGYAGKPLAGSTTSSITMDDNSGAAISNPSLQGTATILFQDGGSAE
jgi:hypothetical protein